MEPSPLLPCRHPKSKIFHSIPRSRGFPHKGTSTSVGPRGRQLWMQNQIECCNFLRTLTFFSEEKGLLSKPPGTITRALPKRMARGKKNARGGPKVGAGRCHMKGLIASEIGRESHTKYLYFDDPKVLNPRATHLKGHFWRC